MNLRSALRRPWAWIVGVALLVVLVAVVAPFVYINLIRDDAPDPLTFDDLTTTTAAPAVTASVTTATSPTSTAAGNAGASTTPAPGEEALDGTWVVGAGSQAGYRVKEVLFGQDTEAVGRTSDVSGELTIAGTTVTAARLVVDLTTVESDDDRRDNQFRGRIMDTDTHPEATFVLTEPIRLDALPADGETVTVSATGQFTIRGVTNPATFELTARRNGDAIEVNGSIPIAFVDYGIPDASFGPAQVEDHGEIELLVTFVRAA